jgi:hypothetical protein
VKRAVDFDGTLAKHYMDDEHLYVPGKVGDPIPVMVARVRRWLAAGDDIIIFTARVHPRNGEFEVFEATEAIQDFCRENFGKVLQVTCMKDPEFSEFWDDKAIRVETDTGSVCMYDEMDGVVDGPFTIPGDLLR